jgi:hypothetical protein
MIRFNILKAHALPPLGGRVFHIENTPVRETLVDAYGNYSYSFKNEVRLPQGPFQVADSPETRAQLEALADDGVVEIVTEEAA